MSVTQAPLSGSAAVAVGLVAFGAVAMDVGFLLGVLLIGLRWSYGMITVLLAGLLVFAVARYTPVGVQVVGAYFITWLLLLSGVRRVLEVGALSADGANLSQLTFIPRAVWYLLWLAATLAAVAVGGKMLVMPA